MIRSTIFLAFLLAAILFTGGLLTAQSQPAPKQEMANDLPTITVKKLSVNARSAPLPRLRYQLLPNAVQKVPGNAALSYHRAMLMLNEFNSSIKNNLPNKEAINKFFIKDEDHYFESIKKPRTEIPLMEVRKFVEERTSASVLREIRAATFCETCDWNISRRIDADNIGTILPELQNCRTLARQLMFNARLKTLDGKLDEALADIRDGVTLAKRTGEANSLISMLVGIAIMAQQINEIEFLIQYPDAPNLYWALTDLPSPFLDKQGIIEGELRGMASLLAVMKEVDKGPMTEAKAQDVFVKLTEMLKKIGGEGSFTVLEEIGIKAGLSIMMAAQQEPSKKILLEVGKTEKEIAAMSPTQRYLLAEWYVCQDLNDTWYTTFRLPMTQAVKELASQEKKLKEALSKSRDVNPLRTMFVLIVPAIQKAYQANIRIERQIAALRCIEAIRMYASHAGKLPEKLEDITEVVLPNDPLFEKPIGYKLEKGTAILSLPNPQEDKPTTGNNYRYEITLVK